MKKKYTILRYIGDAKYRSKFDLVKSFDSISINDFILDECYFSEKEYGENQRKKEYLFIIKSLENKSPVLKRQRLSIHPYDYTSCHHTNDFVSWGIERTGCTSVLSVETVRIGLADSGVDLNMLPLQYLKDNLLFSSIDFNSSDREEHTHGSAMLSIMAGSPTEYEGNTFTISPNKNYHGIYFAGTYHSKYWNIINLYKALFWFYKNGVDVVSLPLAYYENPWQFSSPVLSAEIYLQHKELIDYILNLFNAKRPFICVAAHGNKPNNRNSQRVVLPADCDHVISIGGLNKENVVIEKRSGCTFVAPSDSLCIFNEDGELSSIGDTSAATAFGSAIIGQWVHTLKKTGSFSVDQLMEKLIEDADTNIISNHKSSYGYGLLMAP